MKTWICSICGLAGGVVTFLVGGWDTSIIALLVFMLFDYITGLLVAGVFHKSKKTKTGGLDSKIGYIGLVKKAMVFCFVVIGNYLDLILGLDIIRNAVIFGFMANELLSIIENAGLMGVPIPAVIKKGLELLQDKGESE